MFKSLSYLFVISILTLLAGTFAFAATESTVNSQLPANPSHNAHANINSGNVEVGGSAGLTYQRIGGSRLTLSPTAKYFVTNKLALGGTVNYSSDSIGSDLEIGPAVSYYFWSMDRIGTYLGLEVLHRVLRSNTSDFYNEGTGWSAAGKLGLNYFVTPEVAVGPTLQYARPAGRTINDAEDTLSLIGNFSIYL